MDSYSLDGLVLNRYQAITSTNTDLSFVKNHFNGFVQDCSISTANALEILQSCTKPSIWCYLVTTNISTSITCLSSYLYLTPPVITKQSAMRPFCLQLLNQLIDVVVWHAGHNISINYEPTGTQTALPHDRTSSALLRSYYSRYKNITLGLLVETIIKILSRGYEPLASLVQEACQLVYS